MTDDTLLPPPPGEEPGPPAPDSGQEPRGGSDERLEECRRTAELYKDRFLRKAAEFENYKRRTDADLAGIIRNANESLLLSLLPILDDLHRSLRAGAEAKDFDAFYRGIAMIHAKLLKTLEGQGLSPFDAVGRPFNVDEHDALLQVERTDVPPHTVVEEVERGYRLHDRVLRHARVIVSAAPETAPEPPPPPDGTAS